MTTGTSVPTKQGQRQAIQPTAIRRAICRRSAPISPLQYYSQVGETIYTFEYSTHQVIGKLFVHLDPAGTLLTQTFISETPKTKQISYQDVFPLNLQDSHVIEANFEQSLLDMHILADQSQTILYEVGEFNLLREKTKKPPVIIGGCGRSGTTLLLSILGAHPDILAFPEELYAFYPKPYRLRKLLAAIEDYGKNRNWITWCEKTPKNVRAFMDIYQLFDGEVKLIHMVRDGRDVVTSHHPSDNHRYYVDPERWVADVDLGLRHADKTFLIRYEDLIREPEVQLKKVCDYIGFDFDVHMLSHERFSSVQQNKAWDGLQATMLNSERVGRWRSSENSQRVSEFMVFPGAIELLQELHYE